MRIRDSRGLWPCRVAAVVGVAGLLVLGGCGPGDEEAVAEFPASSARELVPSGAVVVGYPPAAADPELQERTMPWGQVVADGAGQVWLTTSWGVTRVDPTSGESTSWDAGRRRGVRVDLSVGTDFRDGCVAPLG